MALASEYFFTSDRFRRRLSANVRGIMFKALAYAVPIFLLSTSLAEAAPNFTGSWSADLRSTEERKNNVGCGYAIFDLTQSNNEIIGNHTFSTPGCGRLNEGGEGTVKGKVKGTVANLTVSSGRNGAVFVGTATMQGNTIRWAVSKQIRSGEPEDDSPLVLQKGVLIRAVK
jgi:hypothetical protein